MQCRLKIISISRQKIGGIIYSATTLNRSGSISNYDNITATKTDPQYVGGIAGSITNVYKTGTLTSNGDIEITLTSLSNSDLNKVKGSEFSWKLVNLLGKKDCKPVWEGSDYLTKGVTYPSTIKNDKNISIFIGNKTINSNINNNCYIYVNQKHVKYNVYWSHMWWHWGTKYVNGVAFDINVAATGYNKFYYMTDTSTYIYSTDIVETDSTMINIDNRHKNGRPNLETARDWQNKFANTTFSVSIF